MVTPKTPNQGLPPTGAAELSPRARRFLATLERRAAIPTEEVEAIIQTSGFPCFAPWLAFHERYAGFVHQTDYDWFIWGLAHRDPYWLDPNAVQIDSRSGGQSWHVTCADCHPSYNYRLDHTGIFLGGDAPAESYDIHVEQGALGWEFKQIGQFRAWKDEELRDPAFRALFEERIEPHPVPEATDCYSRYFMSARYFVVQSVKTGTLRRGYEVT